MNEPTDLRDPISKEALWQTMNKVRYQSQAWLNTGRLVRGPLAGVVTQVRLHVEDQIREQPHG